MAADANAAGCVFCDIVAGHGPASVVYSDETVLAFLDIRPLATGHLLVIPRAHAPYLADLDPAVGEHMFGVAQQMAAALRRSGLPCQGVNLFLADGEAAFQEVFHVHLHVIPRNRGDGFRLHAKWRRPPRAELDSIAGKVRGDRAPGNTTGPAG
jgi:histidine triad (HIT) family protein